MFSLQFTTLDFILIGIVAVCVAGLLLYYIPLNRRVTRRVEADTAEIDGGALDLIADAAYPSVSVIVYVNGNAVGLAEMLPYILEQDYPAPMEVIVVNDGPRAVIEDAIGDLEMHYNNLYMTFTPPNSRNLSRKKLSLMLGVKAARYDTLMMTTASCRPCSPLWLRSMMRHVAAGDDIVIGMSVDVATDEAPRRRESRIAAFDIASEKGRYLSWAIKGRPYRADGNNLAYRREVFTANRGFSTHLNFNFGDDDIFIHQVARNRRTSVELSQASVVRQLSDDLKKSHSFDKLRYDFTGRHIKTDTRYRQGLASTAWWVWALVSLAIIVKGVLTMQFVMPAATVVLGVALCVPVMVSWRHLTTALYLRRLTLTVPWMMLAYPFYNLAYRYRGYRNKTKNYTWTSEKLF